MLKCLSNTQVFVLSADPMSILAVSNKQTFLLHLSQFPLQEIRSHLHRGSFGCQGGCLKIPLTSLTQNKKEVVKLRLSWFFFFLYIYPQCSCQTAVAGFPVWLSFQALSEILFWVRMIGDTLRKYLWLWMIVGVLLLSAVIIFIFLLINRYITRGGMSASAPPFAAYHLVNFLPPSCLTWGINRQLHLSVVFELEKRGGYFSRRSRCHLVSLLQMFHVDLPAIFWAFSHTCQNIKCTQCEQRLYGEPVP